MPPLALTPSVLLFFGSTIRPRPWEALAGDDEDGVSRNCDRVIGIALEQHLRSRFGDRATRLGQSG
jgi:hypothetical protein